MHVQPTAMHRGHMSTCFQPLTRVAPEEDAVFEAWKVGLQPLNDAVHHLLLLLLVALGPKVLQHHKAR